MKESSTFYDGVFIKLLLLVLWLLSVEASAHSSPQDGKALQVCEGKKKSEVCRYTDHHDYLYIGTCQYINKDKLTCVRTKPLKKSKSKS